MSFGSFADKIFTICILKPGDYYELLLMISNIIDSSQDKATLLFVSDFDLTVNILVSSVDYGLNFFYKNDVICKTTFSFYRPAEFGLRASFLFIVHVSMGIGKSTESLNTGLCRILLLSCFAVSPD